MQQAAINCKHFKTAVNIGMLGTLTQIMKNINYQRRY